MKFWLATRKQQWIQLTVIRWYFTISIRFDWLQFDSSLLLNRNRRLCIGICVERNIQNVIKFSCTPQLHILCYECIDALLSTQILFSVSLPLSSTLTHIQHMPWSWLVLSNWILFTAFQYNSFVCFRWRKKGKNDDRIMSTLLHSNRSSRMHCKGNGKGWRNDTVSVVCTQHCSALYGERDYNAAWHRVDLI